jgi:hypothetical protein
MGGDDIAPADPQRLAELANQVTKVVVSAAELPCFVSMPYEEHANQHYEEVIRSAIEDADMRSIRSDHR